MNIETRDGTMSSIAFRIVDRQRFEVAWPLARLAGKRANRENQGTGTESTMFADRRVSFRRVDEF